MTTPSALLAAALRWLLPRLPLIGGVALLTLALALSCGPRRIVTVAGPTQPPRVDTVTVEKFTASRPDTTVGKVEGALHPVVRPEHVVVAPGAGSHAVAAFCADPKVDTVRLASTDSAGRDSVRIVVTPAPPAVLSNGLRYDRRLFGTGRLTLYTVSNDSTANALTYGVGNWGYTGALEGNRVVVQGDRFGAAKTIIERGLPLTLGAVAGYLIRGAVGK